MLRGIDPKVTHAAIDTIVRKLRERKLPVLIAGMLASPNLGPDYAVAFRKIFSDAAKTHDALLYPFFLEGIAGNSSFNQPTAFIPPAPESM